MVLLFGKRLRNARKSRGLTLDELSKIYNEKYSAGLNKGTLSKYENEKQEPMISVVKNLSIILGVNVDYLLGTSNEVNISATNRKGVKIPVLGKVPAGVPIEAVEDIIDYEEIPVEMAKNGEFFGLQIKGDSMEPRICEGDVVIIKKQDDAESGDLVIAMINGNEATCKRLMKYKNGIRLIPNNPTYEPLYFSNKEIEEKPVKIIGKVVENRQKY